MLLEHEKAMCCVYFGVGWSEKKERERASGKKENEKGRLGKAKENQYVSDKKAQILDVSSV